MKKTMMLAALGLALGGCATQAERTAMWQAEADRMKQTFGPACERLGYTANDDRWRDCVMRLSAREEARYAYHPRSTTCFGRRGYFNCTTF